jgi:uncharacterized protein YkwD
MLFAVGAGCTTTLDSKVQPARQPARICQPAAEATTLVEQVLDRVNQARLAEELEPLVLDPLLSAVADDFACQMIEDGFLAHTHPVDRLTPGERLTSAGYIYYAMGENLAAGQSSPEEVVTDWLTSEAHRANILSPEWREVGIAVRRGGEYGWYWVQEFADPVEFVEVTSTENMDRTDATASSPCQESVFLWDRHSSRSS